MATAATGAWCVKSSWTSSHQAAFFQLSTGSALVALGAHPEATPTAPVPASVHMLGVCGSQSGGWGGLAKTLRLPSAAQPAASRNETTACRPNILHLVPRLVAGALNVCLCTLPWDPARW